MKAEDHIRPDPDALLNTLKKEEAEEGKGRLKIFFGMSAGVGKTYDMLKSAHEAKSKGIDVVIGYVETHKRPETEALLAGLPVIPRKSYPYRGTILEEMDLDAILTRKPRLALVDELAHTNAPGSRHTKRFQDVQEILESGIDVYTTVNVQHLESRADTVAQITGTTVRETVPDSIFDQADEVEIIDIPPDDLLKRLSEGKVYTPERSQQAIENFFRKGTLTALREMSLRLTAERVDHQLRDYMRTERISGPWKSGQRLLVGISPSPQSATLIRWGRRMAYTMDASWIAVYVEGSSRMTDATKARLAKNIKLARELGAEIITTADEDVARALVRVARQQNSTQILVGKPQQQFSFRKNLLDRVIEQSGELDVYVVGGENESPKRPALFRIPELHSGILQYLAAAAAVCAVGLLCYPLSGYLGYQTVSLILLLTVALLPLKLGAGPVLLAAGASALVWDFFFIPPRFTFVVARGQDILMLATYFAIAAVTGALTARVRAREKAVRSREERTQALYSLTKDLANATSQTEVAEAAVSNLRRFFQADVAIFLTDLDGEIFTRPHESSSFAVDEKEFGVAAWVYWNEKKAGKFTDTLPFAQAIYYPMSGPRYPLGVVGVRFNQQNPPAIEQEVLLENFISQVASTLEREQLNEMAKRSIAIAESERLYKTLFNSISHELRTPIAAIVSASEGLLDERTSERTGVRNELAGEIHTAAQRLNRLIGNLLDMTRLESGRLAPVLDWCEVRDLINTAADKLAAELNGHTLSIDIPAGIPLVKVDFGLMEQVLVNLLHNAASYTPAGSSIWVRVLAGESECVIIISDNGPGLPREAVPKLFEKFYRVPGTKAGGTGLGLSIARGFTEAQGGALSVGNREGGGAEFTIRLPLLERPRGEEQP
ncbi:MAG TPA: sensor histidine kinase KdpD [Bacteroidota bacterium]|jgi:two-component system sensor histidine kinase KdpD